MDRLIEPAASAAMSPKHSNPHRHPEPNPAPHPALLAGMAALLVARTLLPSEAVAYLGDGQPFNMLWLSLVVVTSLAAIAGRGLPARRTPADLAVAALILWCLASALIAASQGNARANVNMLWQWASAGAIYWLVRQLVRKPAEVRGLLAVMTALAVALSALGYYQYFVTMPADRLLYARDPDAQLIGAGQYFPPGSIERAHFEARLRSTEPTATFALTNSLAGYLTCWLILGAAMAVTAGSLAAAERRRALFTLAVAGFAVAGCLLLTKSRSGYIAAALGLALLPLTLPAARRRLNWRVLGAVAAAGALLIGGALAAGGLDRALVSGARTSLGYRLEYWRSSLAMIAAHPWIGCGPGNFQDAYVAYKLPEASEEVSDPHNLLFEVWATAGTPAALALVTIFVALAWQLRRSGANPVATQSPSAASPAALGWIVAGAAMAPWLAWILAPLAALDLSLVSVAIVLSVGGTTLWGLWPWVRSATLSPLLAPLAIVALVVHLLASGGIGFPAVSDSLWLLLALAVSSTESILPQPVAARRVGLPVAAMVTMGLAAMAATACHITGYRPVLGLNAALTRADRERELEDWPGYRQALIEAGETDILSSRPWYLLAEFEGLRMLQGGATSTARKRFDTSLAELLRQRPGSSLNHRQAGLWRQQLYDRFHDPADAEQAALELGRAVALYPNSALAHALHALALSELGSRDQAIQEAERAKELDAQMPHADKRLPPELLRQLERLPAAEHAPRS